MPRCATGWGHSSVTELCPLHEVTARDSQAGRAVGGGSPIAPCPCPPSSAPCPLALPAPQARSRCEATVTAPFPGLCRNVTAQSHLELKVWICHTLRNELLGAASVSLGSLLKGGGKRTYGGPRPAPRLPGAEGTGRGWPQWLLRCLAGNKVPLCALGRACRKPYLRQPGRRSRLGNTNPSAICRRLRLPERGL